VIVVLSEYKRIIENHSFGYELSALLGLTHLQFLDHR
jgi:hypothetical protein